MNLKSFLPSWKIVFTFLSLMTLVILIAELLTNQTSNEHRSIKTFYRSLGNKYPALYEKIRTLNASVYPSNFSLPTNPNNIDVESRANKTLQVIILPLIWIFYILTTLIILAIVKKNGHQFALTFERKLSKAQELGQAEGVRAVAQGLIEGEDVLAEVMDWLHNYKRGKARKDEAARIHSKILERLIKQARLISIGETGKVVNFNPQFHSTFEKLKPGEEVIILEPGWRVASDVIKTPIVGRKL